ncbi:alpha/beta fold hydrolase [Aquirhabdus sp.]|uniref:alpha/beta fold hydrolase n=1 Tax=Aquirhabdus sp. TaxID=2824160 RepID=UPI00396CA907
MNTASITPQSFTPRDIAIRFLTPDPRKQPAEDQLGNWVQSKRSITTQAGQVHVSSAGQGPLVMFVHGWEGSILDFEPLIVATLAQGFSVAAIDLPAHGRSEGKRTSIPTCAKALLEIQTALGQDFYAVVAHSLGAGISGDSLERGLIAGKAVLISPPRRFMDAIQMTAVQLGYDETARQQMIDTLREFGVDPVHVDLQKSATHLTIPALILHSDDDRVIPMIAAQSVAAAWAGSRFVPLTGLGHRRLLADAAVIHEVMGFLGEA